tara:strand:+ start:899 stop:1372 length:474 start_codon:yes stop_codon:yes gene_type:complete
VSDKLFQKIVESTVLKEIGEQGGLEYPSEACGVLVAEGNTMESIPFENIQDKLHAIEPERYTRTSLTAYNMNTLKLARVQENRDLRVIYHTHVECGAYFSDEDQECALNHEASGPVLPGVDYLVVSIYDRKPRAANLYRYDQSTNRYELVDGVELSG